MKVDWNSASSEILLNPRLPEQELIRIRAFYGKFPELAGHFWITTSGSSGEAKWTALSKSAILASAEAVNRHLGADRKDIWLHALPSHHVGGLGIWARAHLCGAKVIDFHGRFPKWDPFKFHLIAGEGRATLSALVPAQVFDLVLGGFEAPETLRAVIVGGGALEATLYANARKLGWNLLPSYGLTECSSQVATASLTSLERTGDPVLKILSHIEARTTSQGLLELRSPSLLTGYVTDQGGEAVFQDPKREDWFTTEDQVEISDTGLQVSGRQGSFVKMGGESVDFSRLEAIFEKVRLESSLGSEAVILPVPDERLGVTTQLFFVTGMDCSKARELFDSRVLPIERIRAIHAVAELPRSDLGKLLKAELLNRLSGRSR